MTKLEQLQDDLSKATSQPVKDVLNAEIQKEVLITQTTSGSGGDVAKLVLMMKDVVDTMKRNQPQVGATVSQKDVDRLVKEALSKSKIKFDDLSDELKAHLTSVMKVGLTLNTGTFVGQGGTIDFELYEKPLFQKILSDAMAYNNIYLYGGAGAGKTCMAAALADFLGYEYIELACNQFTSPLEILGGQTIDGYQRGKLERAWGNLDASEVDADGNAMKSTKYLGAVLCLDELPKIDPNTAGALNGALAKVKEYKKSKDAYGTEITTPPTIENGRGQKIKKGNLVIIATGNLKLNEISTEYEANFKQDLSLQDRFAGSTYEVVVDQKYEYHKIMKGFAFIWLAMTKLREKIIEQKWTGFAFVSLRIMINLKETYEVYRRSIDGSLDASQPIKDALKSPKTVMQGVDSFLSLFKEDQIRDLKLAMDYNNFEKLCLVKDSLPLNALNTKEEEEEAMKIIYKLTQEEADKIALQVSQMESLPTYDKANPSEPLKRLMAALKAAQYEYKNGNATKTNTP